MRAFYGGQIRPDHRGDLAVVVRIEGSRYAAFLYPVLSKEFLELTGVSFTGYNMSQRAYIGVSPEAGERIIRQIQDKQIDAHQLESIDRFVVLESFL